MTNAIFTDITGKVKPAEITYKVDLMSRGNKTHLEFDLTWEDAKNNTLADLIKLAVQDKADLPGKKWYKITKDDEGNWKRIEIDEPTNPK